MKTYLVTVTDQKYLENLYEEMETEGKSPSLCDISRSVECALKRPISKTTEYVLSEEEAIELLKCEYVANVEEKNDFEVGVDFGDFDITSSKWKKNQTIGADADLQNWALMRMSTQSRPDYAGWGIDGFDDISGTVTRTLTGKNVDIVILETTHGVYVDHPEFLDKNGNSRVQLYDWHQHTQEVEGRSPIGSYPYGTAVDEERRKHVNSVASAAAGLNYSFAPEANIYILSANTIGPEYATDYIRAFHRDKPINPETGRQNPTIVNCSFAYGVWINLSKINQVIKEGAVSQANSGSYYTRSQLLNFGVFQDPGLYYSDIGGAALLPASDINPGFYSGTTIVQSAAQSSRIASLGDAMGDGIIFVSASANLNGAIVKPTDSDYNTIISSDEFLAFGQTPAFISAPSGFKSYYANRGAWPGISSEFLPYNIIIGATNSTVEEKRAFYSNFGTAVTAYAPGTNIPTATYLGDPGGTDHPDSFQPLPPGTINPPPNHLIRLSTGTSISAPMVTGMLAAALEVYPYWTQKEAYEYLIATSLENTLSDTTNINDPDQNYLFGPNRQAFRKIERNNYGNVYPQNNLSSRKESGVVYPRPRIKRNKRVNKKLPYISSVSYNGQYGTQPFGDYEGTPLARRGGTKFNIVITGSNIPDGTVLYWNIVDADGNPGTQGGYVNADNGTIEIISNQAIVNILIPTNITDTKLMVFSVNFYEKEQYDFNTYQQLFYAYYV